MLQIVILFLLVSLAAVAQTPTPPPQPVTGPGGSTYLYPSYQKLGPYYSLPNQNSPYTAYYIFEPAGTGLPSSLPVVLFLHGYLLPREGYPYGDSPWNYTWWLVHLARMGYTVVFPEYDYQQEPEQFTNNIIQSWGAALNLLASGQPGLIPPASDSQGMQTMFAGHSMGAYQSFAVAQELTLTQVAGIPLPRAIAGFSPGVGESALSTDLSAISPSISVIIAHGDEDTNNFGTVTNIWNSISTQVPAANRDLLEVISDSHGSPAQLGNHYFPDTNGVGDDDSGVDDRDYNVTWKLSVGLFNCVLYGTDCSYGLGHGSADQINMGDWSDGTPVNLLSLQNGN